MSTVEFLKTTKNKSKTKSLNALKNGTTKPLTMKILLISILSLSLACLYSTNHADVNPSSKGGLIHVSGNDFTLFFNLESEDFYLLQAKEKITVPKDCSFQRYDKAGGLVVFDNNTSGTTAFHLGDQIYGIAHMSGEKYTKSLILNTKEGVNFVPNPGGVIEELSCACYPSSSGSRSCDSGGEGSNGCEITDGGGTGTINWNNQCQVSCNTGFYACCNE